MTPLRIVVDRDIPFIHGVLDPHAEVTYLRGAEITPAALSSADALIVRTRTRCDESLLRGSAVRFIASATIGFDHIDTAYCAARGITWTNAPGCNASSVQQYVAAALLTLTERRALTLAGKTIGIVGVGNVGRRVDRLCRVLGMTTLLNDPPRARAEGADGFVSLAEIIERSDIITLHVPLARDGEDRTFHLVDSALLAALRPDQFLINSSRGEVVESAALTDALRERRLAGCVLDVWEHEPDIDRQLLAAVDLATPHIAGYSADGKANGTAISVQAVSRHFGLGLDAWYPRDIPAPPQPTVTLAASAGTVQQQIAAAVRATYDIVADDARLRADPASFERQRVEHPVRREFVHHQLVTDGLPPDVARPLLSLGMRPVETP